MYAIHILVYTFQMYYFYFNKKIFSLIFECKDCINKYILKKDS